MAEGRSMLGKGIAYRLGAKDPVSGFLDCSGYVDEVFYRVTDRALSNLSGGNGGRPEGGTWHQRERCGRDGGSIVWETKVAGDVVFWGNPASTYGHVGIATGEGTVLECSSRFNGIRETPWGPEWAANWTSAWRIV